jgi:hypothetical protein
MMSSKFRCIGGAHRWAPRLVALAAAATMFGVPAASAASAKSSPAKPRAAATVPANPNGITFNGTFSSLSPWSNGGGGAQCSNYGTKSSNPRMRGTFNLATNVAGVANAGLFTLPADTNKSTYPLEACDLLTKNQPINLGADQYYGLMIYVPQGWTIPNNAFDGVEIAEYHFQNVYGAPISFQLHPDHVTLAVQTGACTNHATKVPGCVNHSNADNPNGNPGTLPAYYAIPTGAFQEGAWNEIMMHVHWANDSTGQIQTWYKTMGAANWTQSTNISGIPTVQWDTARGSVYTNYVDETEAYTSAVTSPLSLYLGNDVTGSSFNSVAATMP